MNKIYLYLSDVNEEFLFSFCKDIAISHGLIFNKELEPYNLTQQKQIVFDEFSKHNDYCFVLSISKEEALSDSVYAILKNAIETLNKWGIKNSNISVSVLDDTHKFTDDEWHKIEKLNNFLNRYKSNNNHKNIKFGFEDQSKTFDIKKVKNTNDILNKTANEIRAKHLSPLEEIIEVYRVVTSKSYNEESETQHSADSRSVYSLLNTDNIVCCGYAEWFKHIIQLINNENIKSYSNTIQIASPSNINSFAGRHENVIVYIKDDKYNVEGYYYLDPTWDFKGNQENDWFCHFFIPLTDLKYYYTYIRRDAMFLELDYEEEKLTKKQKIERRKIFEKQKKLETYFASALSQEDSLHYAQPKNIATQLSISRDEYVYRKPFIQDILESNIFKNTIKDISPFVLEEEYNKTLEKLSMLENKKSVLNDIPDNAKNNSQLSDIIKGIKKDIKQNEKDIKTQTKKIEKLTKLEAKLTKNFSINKILEHVDNLYNCTDKGFYSSPIIDATLKYISTPIPLNKLKSALNVCFKDKEKVDRIIKYSILMQEKYINYKEAQNAISKASKEQEDLYLT